MHTEATTKSLCMNQIRKSHPLQLQEDCTITRSCPLA
ncbi:hypothetical protein CsSME_00016566 [Camellia sinensis var. sinensis]